MNSNDLNPGDKFRVTNLPSYADEQFTVIENDEHGILCTSDLSRWSDGRHLFPDASVLEIEEVA